MIINERLRRRSRLPRVTSRACMRQYGDQGNSKELSANSPPDMALPRNYDWHQSTSEIAQMRYAIRNRLRNRATNPNRWRKSTHKRSTIAYVPAIELRGSTMITRAFYRYLTDFAEENHAISSELCLNLMSLSIPVLGISSTRTQVLRTSADNQPCEQGKNLLSKRNRPRACEAGSFMRSASD